VATRNQRNDRRSELILQAIDKTIADVAAKGGSGAAEKLDALHELRERVATQSLDEDEPKRARPTK
jgi:hypothetical protein